MNKHCLGLLLAIFLLTPAATAAEIKGYTPTGKPYVADWGDARTTGYYTPSCKQFKDNGEIQWCHKEGDCITSTEELKKKYPSERSCIDDASWCCIPQDERGFYESVKCQGSAVCKGKVYHTDTIKPKPMTGVLSGDYSNGKTRTGTDPKKQHTIAVNPNENSDCYIPYGSKVFIDFGPESDWTGTYTAEDTGSAFKGKGRADNGNCKIDIYTGVGKDSLEATKGKVTKESADVYILKWGSDDVPLPQNKDDVTEQTTTHATGNTRAKYTTTVSFKPPAKLYNKARAVVKELQGCKANNYQDLKECADNVLSTTDTKSFNVSNHCKIRGGTAVPSAKPGNGQVIVAKGTVHDTSPLKNVDGRVQRSVTIQSTKQRVSLFLQSKNPAKLNKISKGDEITVYDRSQPQRLEQKNGVFIEQPLRLDRFPDITLNEKIGPQKKIRNFLVKAADCTSANKLCVCEAKHPGNRIAFSGQRASLQSTSSVGSLPYYINLTNGSSVQTKITPVFLKQPNLFKKQLNKTMKKLNDQRFTSPATDKTSYLLHRDNKLAFLNKKPQWYKGSDAAQLISKYQQITKTWTDIQTGNIAGLLNDIANNESKQPPHIPACELDSHHQPVCITYNPPKSPKTSQIRSQAMSIPPLKFTVKI